MDEWQFLWQRLSPCAIRLYGIIKILRQDGYWLRFNTQEFAKKYGFTKSTLHRALAELSADPEINFEWTAKEVKVRFLLVPNLEQLPKTAESIDFASSHSQQEELVPFLGFSSQNWDENPKNGTVVPKMGQSQPETLTQQSAQPSYRYLTDIKQTHTDSALANATPLPHPEVCAFENFGNEEEQQKQVLVEDQVTHANSSSDQQNQDPAIMSKSTHEGKNCAAPPENDSQNQCSDDPELWNEFYKWQGAAMNQGKESTPAADLRSGRNWARKNPEDAKAVFEQWKKDRATASKRSRYDCFHEQQHALVLKEYQLALEKAEWGQTIFLDQFYRNNPGWLEWVKANHPEWLQIAA
jgi:hypothetical protein